MFDKVLGNVETFSGKLDWKIGWKNLVEIGWKVWLKNSIKKLGGQNWVEKFCG